MKLLMMSWFFSVLIYGFCKVCGGYILFLLTKYQQYSHTISITVKPANAVMIYWQALQLFPFRNATRAHFHDFLHNASKGLMLLTSLRPKGYSLSPSDAATFPLLLLATPEHACALKLFLMFNKVLWLCWNF